MRSAIEREKKQARGIVIRHGAYLHEASAFLAYLWSEESELDERRLAGEPRLARRESLVTRRK